jgi:hypothetical protein
MTSRAAAAGATPVLSLILCSRNDNYMGNARWRLETALAYLAARLQGLGRLDQVEVIVADWGSQAPLRHAVALTPAAARIVSFVTVPPPLATTRQRDSPFPEVLALNAAARRARGAYIGRIDQDTLVGEGFLGRFFDWVEGGWPLDVPLERTLLFANRRSVPYRFAAGSPSLSSVTRFVRWFGRRLRVWRANLTTGDLFWTSYVGLWLAHRDRWLESSGYDERLIYYNWMETDMICRLRARYPVVDLGAMTGYDFYHLEHYHPWRVVEARVHAIKNADIDVNGPVPAIRPNPDSWGLADLALPLEAGTHVLSASERPGLAGFSWAMVRLTAGLAADIVVAGAGVCGRWMRRARRVGTTLRGQAVTRWPGALRKLWAERKTAHVR